MSCEFENRIDAFVDGQLGDEQAATFARHIEECAGCAALTEQLRAFDGELRAGFRPWRTSHEGFAERTAHAAREVTPLARKRPWLAPVAAAAIGFFGGWIAFHGSSRHLPPADPMIAGGSAATFARLSVSTGTVEIQRPRESEWTPLPREGSVPAGSHIRTSDHAKGVVTFADGSEIRIDAGTEVSVASNRAVDVPRGRIFLRATAASQPFSIVTLDGRVTTLGARIDVTCLPEPTLSASDGEVTPPGTTVLVVDGTAFNGPTTIPAGFECRMEDGTCHTPRRATDPLVATSWIHELLAAAPQNPELDQRLSALLDRLARDVTDPRVEAELRAVGDQALPALARFIETNATRERSANRCRAVTILADLADVTVVCNLLSLLADSDPEVRAESSRGLRRLTGETLGFDDTYWLGPDTSAGLTAWNSYLRRPGSVWNRCQSSR